MQQKAQMLLSSDFSYPLVIAKNSATKTFFIELKNPRAKRIFLYTQPILGLIDNLINRKVVDRKHPQTLHT